MSANSFTVNGWTCGMCYQWVAPGGTHQCYTFNNVRIEPIRYLTCQKCGKIQFESFSSILDGKGICNDPCLKTALSKLVSREGGKG